MAMAESSHFSSLIRTYGNPPGLFARSTSWTLWTISVPPSGVNCSSCMETPSISSPTLHAPRARTPSTSLRTTAPTGLPATPLSRTR